MPYCQHCGAENAADAKFCKECGQPPFGDAPVQTAPQPAPQTTTPAKKKRPAIGLGGIVLVVVGVLVGCNSPEWGIAIGLVGLVVLIYALLTGNVKFWG